MKELLREGSKGKAVTELQQALNRNGAHLFVDGDFGPATHRAVVAFQRRAGLVVDGIAGSKTWSALAGEDCQALLHEGDLIRAANRLDSTLAAIKAVNEVESRGTGFFGPGKPAILFERHIMRRRLLQHGISIDGHPIELVNARTGGYVGGMAEHRRLDAARSIHEPSAIESTSWGLFQIMGFHHQVLGYKDARDFEAQMSKSEGNQLDAFVRFIEADRGLHNALKRLDWTDFARRYNGPAFAKNSYDLRMAAAYRRYADPGELAA